MEDLFAENKNNNESDQDVYDRRWYAQLALHGACADLHGSIENGNDQNGLLKATSAISTAV